MNVQILLREKGSKVFSIEPGKTMNECMKILNDNRIGAVLVIQKNEVVGILSERDILWAAYKHCGQICELKVAEVMTPAAKVVFGAPNLSIFQVMELMTDHKIRHLPIMDGKNLLGVVSIGDVVKALHDETAAENTRMREYITGSLT